MAASSLDVSADLELSGSGDEVRVQLERGRMRLDVRRLGALARLARASSAIGGLRSLLARLPARQLELALRGRVFASRVGRGGLAGGWRLHPVGLLQGLSTRA